MGEEPNDSERTEQNFSEWSYETFSKTELSVVQTRESENNRISRYDIKCIYDCSQIDTFVSTSNVLICTPVADLFFLFFKTVCTSNTADLNA